MTFANWWTSKYGPETKDVTAKDFALMQDAYETGMMDEREACAKRWETLYGFDKHGVAEWLRSNDTKLTGGL